MSYCIAVKHEHLIVRKQRIDAFGTKWNRNIMVYPWDDLVENQQFLEKLNQGLLPV